MEAVKRKMESKFLASSSNSEEEEGQGSKKKKKKRKLMWQRRLKKLTRRCAKKPWTPLWTLLKAFDQRLTCNQLKRRSKKAMLFFISDRTSIYVIFFVNFYCEKRQISALKKRKNISQLNVFYGFIYLVIEVQRLTI